MNTLTSRGVGWLALTVGVAGILALISLGLLYIGLFQNIHSLSFMGVLNDTINVIGGSLSAVLALRLHLAVRQAAGPRLSLLVLIGAWVGAILIAIGSWLIQTGRADLELSSYYFFFGNGLFGIWLWVLNRIARQQSVWPRRLIGLGSIASLFMMFGMLSLPGILLGLDGDEFSPLIMVSGISYLGTGILYPTWCLWLARRTLSTEE